MQLARVIELGMDVDGDGSADLDGSRISYHGQSAGGVYGAILAALDPSVKLLTISGCCGLIPEHAR
jgi:cephalosporin-C deacetylase-like acetyl esterase